MLKKVIQVAFLFIGGVMGFFEKLKQDMDLKTLEKIIEKIKTANIKYDTPITVKAENTIRDAMWIIHKRSHNRVIMINENEEPISIFSEKDMENLDQYSKLWNLKQKKIITGVESETFKTSGKIFVSAGWKEVYGKKVEEDFWFLQRQKGFCNRAYRI